EILCNPSNFYFPTDLHDFFKSQHNVKRHNLQYGGQKMQAGQRIKVFLLAGIKTSPSAFHVLQQRLQQRIEDKGYTADIEMLFPYGEMERNVVLQVMEVRADLSRYVYRGGIGSRKVWNRVERHGKEQKLLLIGHSGGGVAAYQIARRLYKDKLPVDSKVI